MQYSSGAHSEFPYSVDHALTVQPEQKAKRVIGFLIDLIPAFILGLINIVPVIGWMAHGLLSACYWLLRDITGASLGKMAMRSIVVREDGAPASTSQKILRNVPLALPGLMGMIPLIGLFFELGIGTMILLIEVVLLLTTGRRLGDRLAGTIVVQR